MNIVVYIVPLIALILGVTEVTGRKESMAVTLSQPLRRIDYLLGTYLGVAGALSTALMIGLGGAGVLIAVQTSTASIAGYLTLLAASLGLMLSFLSLAFLVGVFLLDRLKSTAAAIVIWFVTVVGYDLALIGVTSVLRGLPLKSLLIPAILLNPVDISRVMVTLASERGALFGPAGATLVEVFGHGGGALLAAGAMLAQIVVPLVIAAMLFGRRDL
ncbi:MAG: ABC transporter permease subunit [Candidatus Eisenbacteria bacterium]|uniref:ABC transporter permease subunit n=1 Tax=Eiseniibacteriota bacterium TaxID=2212470 RepID=A0A7Y2E9A5_UNCEI|nr:ABC transporter permease subunit [Candidatus Eisenbacteria bacterium]